MNPTLADLVGGIDSVTLSDEEARRRGTQKTVLERRAPPTFDVLVEMQDRDRLAIQQDVSAAVDALVRGNPLPPEIRSRESGGKIHIEKAPIPAAVNRQTGQQQPGGFRRLSGGLGSSTPTQGPSHEAPAYSRQSMVAPEPVEVVDLPAEICATQRMTSMQPIRIYPYGVARNRLMQAQSGWAFQQLS
jgi:hypothetical protein